jgi:hypothetical protein
MEDGLLDRECQIHAAKTRFEVVLDFDIAGNIRVIEIRFHLATILQAIASTVVLAVVAGQSRILASIQVLLDWNMIVTLRKGGGGGEHGGDIGNVEADGGARSANDVGGVGSIGLEEMSAGSTMGTM